MLGFVDWTHVRSRDRTHRSKAIARDVRWCQPIAREVRGIDARARQVNVDLTRSVNVDLTRLVSVLRL